MPAGQFQQISELAPDGINSKTSVKAKRNPQEGINGEFHFQWRSELAPNGSNSEVPAGKLLRSLQFLHGSELAPIVIITEMPAGEFRANRVLNSNKKIKFW